MEQQYTISIGWRICYGLFAIILIGISLFVLNQFTASAVTAAILMGTAGALILINQFKNKLIITETNIVKTTVFGTIELFIADIKGFRIYDKVIVIEPLHTGYKKLKIRNYLSIGNINELENWLNNSLRNLGREEYNSEKEQLLDNTDLGLNVQEREARFKTMNNLSLTYNLVVIGIVLLYVYVFMHSTFSDAFLLIYPMAGIAIIYFSRGLVTLISKKSSAYTNVLMGMYMSVGILLLRSFTYYHISNYSCLAVPALVLSVPSFSVLFFKGFNKTYNSRIGQLLLMIVLSGGYGVGAALNINCLFDGAKPLVYPVSVTARHISNKKTTSYHIRISGWGNNNEGESITVPASFYYQATVGSIVHVMEKPGLFKMPWYYVGL